MRTRKALRVLMGGGAPKALRQAATQPGPGPNRSADWVAAQVLLPNGRMTLVTDEFTTNKPITNGGELKRLEAMIASNYQAHDGAVPLVGAKVEAHVISFTTLRTFYVEPEEKPAPEAGEPAPLAEGGFHGGV